MRSMLVSLGVALLLSTPAAWGQASGNGAGNDAGVSLADQRPADNVKGGAVWQRSPGRTVAEALARHRARANQRLAAQRTGETWLLAPEPLATSGFASPLSGLLGGSLSDLLGSFLGSGLGGQTGGSLLPLGNAPGSAGTGGTDFSNLPPEVIQMLAGAGIDLKDLNQKGSEDSAAAAGALPKSSSRSQTSGTQQQPKFVARWADAMLSTIFTAVTVGLQTQDFIDVLKDAFRPLFIPEDKSAGDAGTGGDTPDKPSNDGDGSDGGLI